MLLDYFVNIFVWHRKLGSVLQILVLLGPRLLVCWLWELNNAEMLHSLINLSESHSFSLAMEK